jgi:crotonobetainyl-CoA:carnitine CoA-transferase CaiB-like acyl-CoA transferase
MMLGDLGADVIKVEMPGSGDESRGWGPPFSEDGQSAYYLSCNRNKLSIALHLADQLDRRVLDRLIAGADVVLENFRRGALSGKGIDAGSWLEKSPGLIWCTISGFGPESDRPGYDFVVQAEAGWMSITGEQQGAPMKVGIALADVIAGKDATIAILGALLNRSLAGGSLPPAQRRLHVSLRHSATAALINVAQNFLVSGTDAQRWGNAHANLVPYQMFGALDGQVVIAVGNDGQWKAACRALGLDSLHDDPSLDLNAGRLAHRQRVVETIARRTAQSPVAELLGSLRAAGVPCGDVKSVRQALEAIPADPVTGVSPSIPGRVRLRPPRLNEHGDLIRRLGWGAFGSLGT